MAFKVPASLRWLLTVVLIAAIVALSVTPGQAREDDSAFSWLIAITPTLLQKALHVVCYALLAGLWYWTLEGAGGRGRRAAIVLLACVGLGAALEWAQTGIPGRFGSLTDILLNAAGSLAGLAAVLFVPWDGFSRGCARAA